MKLEREALACMPADSITEETANESDIIGDRMCKDLLERSKRLLGVADLGKAI
jgi:hypothetical protein